MNSKNSNFDLIDDTSDSSSNCFKNQKKHGETLFPFISYITPQGPRPVISSKMMNLSPRKDRSSVNNTYTVSNQIPTNYATLDNKDCNIKNRDINFEFIPGSISIKDKESSILKPKLDLKTSRKIINNYRQKQEKSFRDLQQEKIKQQEKELLVPIDKKDNEKYKLLVIQKLRKKNNFSLYKSAKKYDENNFNENEKKYKKDFLNFSLCKKKKICSYSTKKIINLNVKLYDGDKEFVFPLYNDEELGINAYWQSHIIESTIDDDIDSDKEQIKNAEDYCKEDLMEAFEFINVLGKDKFNIKKFVKNFY